MAIITPAPETPSAALHPGAGQLQEWQALDECHQQVLHTLDTLHQLCLHLEDKGVDARAQELARDIATFFNGAARHHHAEEERVVFPALLQSDDLALVQHVKRLQSDHGWLEEDWLELAPPLEAIAQGYSWYDLDMLRAALPVFAQLYLDHIDLEESLIYPEAKRRLAERQAAGTGRSKRQARERGQGQQDGEPFN
jgi:hemerythrin-like domain-containing protein